VNEASGVKRLARPGEKPMASGLYALSAFLVIALSDPNGLRGCSPTRAAH